MPPALCSALELLETREVPAADFHTLPVFSANDAAVFDHVRAIAAEGAALGRRTDSFVKIGDSNSALFAGEVSYLQPLGSPGFDPVLSGLANYGPNLVQTWAAFLASGADGQNSYTRNTNLAYPGNRVPSTYPYLADAIARANPGVALIMLGTNDAYAGSTAQGFKEELETLLSQLIRSGVVPVLSTVPESLAFGAEITNRAQVLNQVIADVAQANSLPLWNFHEELAGLPALGLRGDRLHLRNSPGGSGRFGGADLLYGQNVHNLGALVMLDWYRRTVSAPATDIPPLPTWASLAGRAVYAVGRDAGQMPAVSVYDSVTHEELNRFYAYEPDFTGGVRTAVADVNGDSIPDIVCGAGPGGGPVIAVFSGLDGSRLTTFLAYEGSFRGGVSSVAVRDLDGDGAAEIAVGAGNGGGPVIAVFSGRTFQERERFLAYDLNFRGGVNVTLGNFANYGATIVAGAGVGGGPNVKFFLAGSDELVRSFFSDASQFVGGVVVAAGDLDGDGFDELAAARATLGSEVVVVDPVTLKEKRHIGARSTSAIAGVRLAMVPDGAADDLLVANGFGATVLLQSYPDLVSDPTTLPPDDPTRAYGLFVG